MSIDEQDQILGRLTRQSGESWRTINALGVKIQAFGSTLATVAKTLNGRDLLAPEGLDHNGAIAKAMRAVKELPDRQALVDCLEELRAETERHKELRSQLDGFR